MKRNNSVNSTTGQGDARTLTLYATGYTLSLRHGPRRNVFTRFVASLWYLPNSMG